MSADLENLRIWKNSNKKAFYHKVDISTEMQTQWFKAHQTRTNDHMFIVEYDSRAVGCMGIRLIATSWDIYNVILGLCEYGGKRIMSYALATMIRFGRSIHCVPVTLTVLKDNPAVSWYKRQGFVITSASDDSFSMQLASISTGYVP